MIVNKFPMVTGGHIYGVNWNGTSTTAWMRTDDSANFPDPVPYKSGASSYGSPFDDIYPWKDMTIVEDSAIGTMVKIPKFWYKLEQNNQNDYSKGFKIQIADYPEKGFHICPACINRWVSNGEFDYILVGRYHCSSAYKSVTGKSKKQATRSSFRTGIHNNGANIYMMDFATLFTIWLLYLVEFADWDSQTKLGYGCGDSQTGSTDNMPYHTGTMQTSRATYGPGVQYRYLEGLWDFGHEFADGCYNKTDGFYIIYNPDNYSDSTGGLKAGKPSSGWPTRFRVTDFYYFPLFYPYNSISSSYGLMYSTDNWNYVGAYPCVRFGCADGGGNLQTTSAGLFAVGCNQSSTDSSTHARPIKFPQKG